jgi:predicted transcriptional regulator
MKTLRDIMRYGFLFTVNQHATVAEAVRIMTKTTDLVIADADEDYQSAIYKMDQANIRHLPIVSEGQLISMLSIRDLLRVNMEDKDAEIHHLHAYLYQVPPSITRASDEL